MLAVIPVRDGVLPSGGAEAVAECDGRALVVGSAPRVDELVGVATDVRLLELGDYAPARWAAELCAHVDDDVVVLPASPDGRDLAPRLAAQLGRRLLAGAILVTPGLVRLARGAGLELVEVAVNGPIVATLQPGVRGVSAAVAGVPTCTTADAPSGRTDARDPVVVEVLPPDVSTMDLAEADRIVGGGAGLDREDRFRQLADVARSLGASTGATRVITDRGWIEHQRQIGTTGVVVDPSLYLAFGISGAVQHTAGLGAPGHIVSVNIDPHCPMMQMADLAIVADANEVLDALEAQLRG
ncbi:MAG: mycofactocin-associated electron transfer flavoprotein alpha subunit [Ilumatobacteraceae bacterium]